MTGLSPVSLWDALVNIYGLTIFVYILLSWFSPSGRLYDIYRLLGTVCEPYIGLFRRFLPPMQVGGGGLDFSPMVAWLVLQYPIRYLGDVILSGIRL